jgi:hypothetical protein
MPRNLAPLFATYIAMCRETVSSYHKILAPLMRYGISESVLGYWAMEAVSKTATCGLPEELSGFFIAVI